MVWAMRSSSQHTARALTADAGTGRRCAGCGEVKAPRMFPPLRLREDGTVRRPTECRSCLAARERARRAARADHTLAADAALLIALAPPKEFPDARV